MNDSPNPRTSKEQIKQLQMWSRIRIKKGNASSPEFQLLSPSAYRRPMAHPKSEGPFPTARALIRGSWNTADVLVPIKIVVTVTKIIHFLLNLRSPSGPSLAAVSSILVLEMTSPNCGEAVTLQTFIGAEPRLACDLCDHSTHGGKQGFLNPLPLILASSRPITFPSYCCSCAKFLERKLQFSRDGNSIFLSWFKD